MNRITILLMFTIFFINYLKNYLANDLSGPANDNNVDDALFVKNDTGKLWLAILTEEHIVRAALTLE